MQAHIACWGLARRCACSLAPTTASDVASAASACRPGLACTLLAALRLELPPACPVSPMLVTLCLPSMPFCWGALAPSGTCLGQHVTFGQRCSPGHWLWCITTTLGLGKNCSCYPRRCLMLLGSGRKHAKAAAAYTLDRLQRWESGERRELWDSRQPPLAPGGRARTLPKRRSLPPAWPEKALTTKLVLLCWPKAFARKTLRPWPASKACTLLQLTKALRSFPAASAPGPSGLPDNVDALLQQLTLVVSLLGSGHACNAASPFLCGALKVGARPIAIGELLRRRENV